MKMMYKYFLMTLGIMLSVGFWSCSSDNELLGEDGDEEMMQQKYTDLKVAITMNAKDFTGAILDRVIYDEKDMEIRSPRYIFDEKEGIYRYSFFAHKRDSKYAPYFLITIISEINVRELNPGDKMAVESVFWFDMLSSDLDTPGHGKVYEFSGDVSVAEIVKNGVVLSFDDFAAKDIHNVDGKAHMTLSMNGQILYKEYVSTNNE